MAVSPNIQNTFAGFWFFAVLIVNPYANNDNLPDRLHFVLSPGIQANHIQNTNAAAQNIGARNCNSVKYVRVTKESNGMYPKIYRRAA